MRRVLGCSPLLCPVCSCRCVCEGLLLVTFLVVSRPERERRSPMQGYVPGLEGAFGESRKCFGELEDWLASAEAAGLQHGEL